MRTLYLDTETYSGTDIKASGLYKYMEDPDFEVLLLPYAWDDEPVRVLDLTENKNSVELQQIVEALHNPSVLKVAHNAAFEREAYKVQFGFYQEPAQWFDTMILCGMNGLPLDLDGAGEALKLEEKKLKEGKALINYFCKPCKPTRANGMRTRNLPEHDPEKWERFKKYAERDVVTMRAIHKLLGDYKITDFEKAVGVLDAKINERGVMIDRELVEAAIAIDETLAANHINEAHRLTGLDNPNSVAQLRAWLGGLGYELDSLNKETISDLLKTTTDPIVRRVLELRQMMGKTSVKKYQAMINAQCSEGRVHGLLQYYGANRTGRWAGRLVQLQNLPQNHLDDIGLVREVVRDRDIETLEMLFDSIPDTLSQLIRTALIAKEGHTFLVADYSAIEARVIAYLASEQWRMDVFRDGGDIYCSSASQMFKVPVVKHGENGHLRAKGKIAELACGYGGGVGAMKNFGADKMGLTEDEMKDIVAQWRVASPNIPRLWRRVEEAAKAALSFPYGKCAVVREGSTQAICTYWYDGKALRCELPSKRILTYWGAMLVGNKITYAGQNQETKNWELTDTWGGKLVENIVQAFARDCLATALIRLDEAGYQIIFHVHDEIIAEAPEDAKWEDMAEIMGLPIGWAPGLLLKAEGYSTKFYMKD